MEFSNFEDGQPHRLDPPPTTCLITPMSLIMEIPFKNFTPRVPPFNVTRRLGFSSDADNVRLTNACIIIIIIINVIETDKERSAIYDFLLVLHILLTMALSHTVSEIKGNICHIFQPRIWRPQLRQFSWNFVKAVESKKTRVMPPPECQKVWRFVHSFINTVSALIRRTDRQTDRIGKTISRSVCIARWHAIKSNRRILSK